MFDFEIISQPDDESCGPSSLYAIYKYYGLDITYNKVVDEVERSISGGTLAPLLGKHALKMGFEVTLYTNNLLLFDPSWFNHEKESSDFLSEKLMGQLLEKKTRYLGATHLFLDFLELGGAVHFRTINTALIETYFLQNKPVLTGLNSTYLYNCKRDWFDEQGNAFPDDIRGTPCGHFVVLHGYDAEKKQIVVADPYSKNPLSNGHYYTVSPDRLINAIMLGVGTYDGNLLIIEPKKT